MAKGGSSIEVLVAEIARPFAVERGLKLVGVNIVKEGPYRYLRLYIDKEGGVSFDDCEAVSRAVDARLDEAIPHPPYDYFEVSSPGLERPIKSDEEFARYVGQKVAVSTYASIDGQKLFIGQLVGLVDGNVVVTLTAGKRLGQTVSLDRQQVASARLHVDF